MKKNNKSQIQILHSNLGFSIIELMVSIVMISILLVALIPVISKKTASKTVSMSSGILSVCSINKCIFCIKEESNEYCIRCDEGFVLDQNGQCVECLDACPTTPEPDPTPDPTPTPVTYSGGGGYVAASNPCSGGNQTAIAGSGGITACVTTNVSGGMGSASVSYYDANGNKVKLTPQQQSAAGVNVGDINDAGGFASYIQQTRNRRYP